MATITRITGAFAGAFLFLVVSHLHAQTAKIMGGAKLLNSSRLPSVEQAVEPRVFDEQIKQIAGSAREPDLTKPSCANALVQLRVRGGLENLSAEDPLISSFDRECLGGADALPATLTAAGIEGVVGIVEVSGSPRCTAFRIRKDVAITAKHCFYNRDTSEPEFGEPPQKVSVRLLASDITAYDARVVSCIDGLKAGVTCRSLQPGPISAAADFVYLQLDGAPLPEIPALSIVDGAPKGELLLLGYWGYAVGDSFRKRVRWTRNAQCYAPLVRNRCIYHSCQAVNGFSGAAMFAMATTAGKLELVGIHLGGVGSGYPDCPDEVTANVGNLGFALSDSQVHISN